MVLTQLVSIMTDSLFPVRLVRVKVLTFTDINSNCCVSYLITASSHLISESGCLLMTHRGEQQILPHGSREIFIHHLLQSKACFTAVALKPFDLILTLMSSWVCFSGVFIRYTILRKPSSSPMPVAAEQGWMNQVLPSHNLLRSSFRQSASGLRAAGRSCLLARTTRGTPRRLSYLRTW